MKTDLKDVQKLVRPDISLRQLDVDDLYIMLYLGRGNRLVDAAAKLGLTQPAITQRIHKIERATGCSLMDRSFRGTRLTAQGQQVCNAASDVLQSLEVMFTKGVDKLPGAPEIISRDNIDVNLG
ncbi:MAG: LysR family transcriptional regulator [Proteobacteria bacterium]|nr:LysR family transcriptional regulator [Pseudomonadota bacterium]